MIHIDLEKIITLNNQVKKVILEHIDPSLTGNVATAIDGVMLTRRDAEHANHRCFEKPLASIIVQGNKMTFIGKQEYHIHAMQCLVAGIDMPSATYRIDPDAPFLGVFFYLDRQILADLLLKIPSEYVRKNVNNQPVAITDADSDILETMLHLLQILDRPDQIPIRAPLILRELHYLFLINPTTGGILQELYAKGSRNNQILQAISYLRHNLTEPLWVENLAKEVNMSLSSLYRHFKSLTGFSPLQYHKRLRLYEARRLMLTENERVGIAAETVGYESVTQFTREYKRMFGEPPHRDIVQQRDRMLGLQTI